MLKSETEENLQTTGICFFYWDFELSFLPIHLSPEFLYFFWANLTFFGIIFFAKLHSLTIQSSAFPFLPDFDSHVFYWSGP